uniref:Uncharacterized protein n=1 Tax=Odontella aurita TaxID=265563 RepID=A0A7S4J8K6_9STRA|mmetsp:Transcript_41267/g.124820  ORF Transcript_41267/g.124820 Transcript_41267/m.124820 type:complete len:507 (+) Transcript_41267:456-1976(+)|eukprot:CAMPEP_0113555594 /NCGR_PEP_ID=MMETSP0015_2-20120614/16803_1 /TAXON_ID=2838 /ORGANISM="Odontella" /LENGTH=506 /DNA_ID=CAMNT_0000456887 /DNA_START=454 /DNA_END=1974 /DNA_ORIENTATION=+ /assembly_acc=CAM_ASM_000160
MNVRHRPVHAGSPGEPDRLGGAHSHRKRTGKRMLVNKDNVGCVAIVAFVLLGLVLFMFFDFHHHEYDIDTGQEVDIDGELEEEVNAVQAAAAAEDGATVGAGLAAEPAVRRFPDEGSGEEPEVGTAGKDTSDGGAALRGGGKRLESRDGEQNPSIDGTNAKAGPSFVTVVLPSVVNPAGRSKRLDAIASTWGPAARALYVVHDTMDYLNGANNLVGFSADGSHYPQLLVLPESIKEESGVLRLQHTVRTIHDAINPDFAFFVNDHTFVMPEHLCLFLSGRDPTRELYAGHAMKNEKEGYAFNSGAAGYVLSKRTMGDLVKKWDEKDPKCLAEHAAKWLQSNPGLVTAKCLRESMHVNAVDTRDEGGRHRFHAFGLVRTAMGSVDEWYLKKHKGLDVIFGPDRHHHQHMPLKGVDCCSVDTVSFHYVEHAETKVFHAVRKKLKENQEMTDDELKSLMISTWPIGRDTGAYAHDLPDASMTEEWNTIIGIFRRISGSSGNKNYLTPPC